MIQLNTETQLRTRDEVDMQGSDYTTDITFDDLDAPNVLEDLPHHLTPAATSAGHADTLVSTREVPWMKLGRLTDTVMTAAEAAEQGGLDFAVEKRSLFFHGKSADGSVVPQEITDRAAIVRSDTQEWLGIMSANYPLLQYSEAFNFMDTITPEYVAAGALKGGRQGFMVVKAPVEFGINDVDPHDMYMVLRTSHDGTRAVEISVMPLRRRCMNQLTLRSFASNARHRWAIPHVGNLAAKLLEAQKSIKNVQQYATQYAVTAERLMDVKLTEEQGVKIITDVLPDRPRREATVINIINRWHTAETVGFDYTGWGLVNAASDYFDWGRTGKPESRFLNALQGSTHRVINDVATKALATV